MIISVLDPDGVMPKKGLRETLIKTNFLLTQRANLQAVAAGVARRIGDGAPKRSVEPKTGKKAKPGPVSTTKQLFLTTKPEPNDYLGKIIKFHSSPLLQQEPTRFEASTKAELQEKGLLKFQKSPRVKRLVSAARPVKVPESQGIAPSVGTTGPCASTSSKPSTSAGPPTVVTGPPAAVTGPPTAVTGPPATVTGLPPAPKPPIPQPSTAENTTGRKTRRLMTSEEKIKDNTQRKLRRKKKRPSTFTPAQ